MDKEKFLKKTSDLIIQENKIIIGLSKLKEVVNKKIRFTSGHRMCAGCGAPVVGCGQLSCPSSG